MKNVRRVSNPFFALSESYFDLYDKSEYLNNRVFKHVIEMTTGPEL